MLFTGRCWKAVGRNPFSVNWVVVFWHTYPAIELQDVLLVILSELLPSRIICLEIISVCRLDMDVRFVKMFSAASDVYSVYRADIKIILTSSIEVNLAECSIQSLYYSSMMMKSCFLFLINSSQFLIIGSVVIVLFYLEMGSNRNRRLQLYNL